MLNRLGAIAHLLDDVVDQSPLDEDDRARFNATCKSAAGSQIDQQVRLEMVDHILRGSRRGNFSPAAVKKCQGVECQSVKLANSP